MSANCITPALNMARLLSLWRDTIICGTILGRALPSPMTGLRYHISRRFLGPLPTLCSPRDSNPRPLPCHGSALPTELGLLNSKIRWKPLRLPEYPSPSIPIRPRFRIPNMPEFLILIPHLTIYNIGINKSRIKSWNLPKRQCDL